MPHLLLKSKNSYLRAIGQITVNMSNLEDEMARCIGILNCPDEGANMRITAGEPFANLLRLLDVLFRYRVSDEARLKEFKTITDALSNVTEKRNINIHGVIRFISVPPDGIIVNRHKYSKMKIGKFGVDRESIPIATLKTLAKEIEVTRKHLSKFISSNFIFILEHQSKIIKDKEKRDKECSAMLGKLLGHQDNQGNK